MTLRQLLMIIFLIIFCHLQLGCTSFNHKLKSWLGGDSQASNEAAKPTSKETKFSDSQDISPKVKRQYKRTTKESLAEESELDQKAGSLWVMEGQGAYLFSQNVVRLVGDPLAVTLEGDPKDQLQSKANVIKKLLAKIEERQKARLRGPAAAENPSEDNSEKDKEKEKPTKESKDKKTASAAPEPESPMDLSVKIVPTRIVERTLEGNYRVKGSQPFMIGSREFKIIVTGIVRAEDFNEEGIGASKLLDPKFDIVSARHEAQL